MFTLKYVDADANVFFILIPHKQKMDVYYNPVTSNYLISRAIGYIHFLLMPNQNKEYISVYIQVNMVDLLWLVGQTLLIS